MKISHLFSAIILVFCSLPDSHAQDSLKPRYIDYNLSKNYEIASITVVGASENNHNSIVLLSGLQVGKNISIPGDEISGAIDKLWKQSIYSNIEIYATQMTEKQIHLCIEVAELPRMTLFDITGLKKFDAGKLKDELKLTAGDVITDSKLNRLKNTAVNFYREKGFLNAQVNVIKKYDSATDGLKIVFDVQRHQKVKISEIEIVGNDHQRIENPYESYRFFLNIWRKLSNTDKLAMSDASIKRKLKNTKQKSFFRFWKRSKYVEPLFKEDITSLIATYNNKGFRDMKVVSDSLTVLSDSRVKLRLEISEGNPYYFGDITFVGNTKFGTDQLLRILNIRKGEVYNEEKLQKNLTFNPTQGDINSLYYDNGYLTFQAVPIESRIGLDTINLEIRIREGKQARLNKVGIMGNTRTNDHVIIRELRVYPGNLFSRSDIMNSMNELRQLRFFNDNTISPDVRPNVDNATADVIYSLEEIGSDQIELSGGWGGGIVVGTIGLAINNFSLQNLFKKDRWKPLPSGDGQKLTLRAASSGAGYFSLSASYTEPWMGGKKPYAFSLSVYHSQESNSYTISSDLRGTFKTTGASVGLGMRLELPDPYFSLYQAISYKHYNIHNYQVYMPVGDGRYHNLNYSVTFGRQSLDGAIYPKTGSEVSLMATFTPPYSLFSNKDYNTPGMTDQDRWGMVEYYKWNFRASLFFNPVANLVINARIRFGALGQYNRNLGYTPFERYKLGGDGMTGYNPDGREIIGMRGYSNESISADQGGTTYQKFTLELRYPITLNPSASIYGLVFFEAGNSFDTPKQLNPFKNYRSAGVGVRLFLAAMGMFGLDWGYGFDPIPGRGTSSYGSQFHFSINQSLD